MDVYERDDLMNSLRCVLEAGMFMYPTHNGLLVGDENNTIIRITFKDSTEGPFFNIRVSLKYLTPSNIFKIKKILERIGMIEEEATTKYRPARKIVY